MFKGKACKWFSVLFWYIVTNCNCMRVPCFITYVVFTALIVFGPFLTVVFWCRTLNMFGIYSLYFFSDHSLLRNNRQPIQSYLFSEPLIFVWMWYVKFDTVFCWSKTSGNVLFWIVMFKACVSFLFCCNATLWERLYFSFPMFELFQFGCFVFAQLDADDEFCSVVGDNVFSLLEWPAWRRSTVACSSLTCGNINTNKFQMNIWMGQYAADPDLF